MTDVSTQASPPAPSTIGAIILNSPTLIMGDSKVGKSSLLATAAEYVWETHKLLSHYYLCDGGGFPTQMQALIRLGIVRVWRMRTRNAEGLVLETCQRASMGWWPARINPHTGDTAPNVALVEPVTTQFVVKCPADGTVCGSYRLQSQIPALLTCPKCKAQVTKVNMQVGRTATRTKGYEKVGAYLFDGSSSMSSWMMDDLAARSGRNELGGEKGAIASVASGTMVFGGNNRASYQFVQQRVEQMINNSQAIPGQVIPAVWTALIKEGSDEGGLRVKGPMLAGNAATAVAPSWFGNCIEVQIETRETKNYRRLMLQPYVDRDGYRHLCGVRSYPGYIPSVLEDEDKGEKTEGGAFNNFSLGMLHKLLDQARAKSEADAAAKYADAPGIAGDVAVMGEEDAPATVEVKARIAPAAVSAPAPRPAGAPVAAPAPAKVAVPAPASATTGGVTAGVAPPTAPAVVVPVPPAPVSTPATPAAPIRPPLAPGGPRGPRPGTPTAAAQPVRPASVVAPAKPVASPMATGPVAAQPPPPKIPMKGPMAAPPGAKK